MRQVRVAVLVSVVVATACSEERRIEGRMVAPRGGASIEVQTSTLVAGDVAPLPPIHNPFEGNVHAEDEGKRLYAWFNCAGCHGAIGGGSIGPPLRDEAWIYGGSSAQIYHSILEGRPNGMPSYRGMPEDSMWKLIAFVRSLGGARPEESISSHAGDEGALRGTD